MTFRRDELRERPWQRTAGLGSAFPIGGQRSGSSMTTVAVRVHSKATVARRVWDGNMLSLWVREPPTDGAANAAVICAVAEWLHVPNHAVRLRSGRSGRMKFIQVGADVKLPPADASGA